MTNTGDSARGQPEMPVVQPTLPLADELRVRPDPSVGRMDDDCVLRAISLIDSSALVETIRAWKDNERKGPGGRPETFPVRALLVAMVLCAMTNQPMLATRFTDVLFRQISPTMRHALGVPTAPQRSDRKGWDDVYRNVRTRFHGLVALMDPSPTPKNRRLDDERFAQLTEARRQALSTE